MKNLVGSTVTFKLNSGEELIAKLTQADGDWLEISAPVSVAPGPQGLGLVPSMFTAELDQEVIMYATAIAMIAPTRGEVKASYIKATSGIDVPPEKKILVG